jgi:hypothetical protein
VKCEYCALRGREVTEGVALESSRTAYHHEPCQHPDCLECPELREACFEASNPNKPVALCRGCAEEHHEHWNDMWSEYYAGLM